MLLHFILTTAKRCRINLSPAHELYCIHLHSFSSKSRNTNPSSSLTENYLITTFGFSKEKAFKISNELNFNIPQKSEALIQFFTQHGFTHAQVSSIVKRTPQVFKMNLDTIILPKIEFFHSLGISSVETAKIITSGPNFLKRSLENKIVPAYEFLKELLLDEESTLFAIRRYPSILHIDFEKVVPVNVERLLEAGACRDKILNSFKQQPKVFVMHPDKFSVCVEKVLKIGFDPETTNFLSALYVMRTAGVNWDRKVEVYRKWGFSEADVLAGFRRSRCCMATSVDKIERVLEYFSRKMGFDRLILMGSPQIISLSLQDTIIPRCTVYRVLIMKGLIRPNTSLAAFLKQSKKLYLEKFVIPYIKVCPEIFKIYRKKLPALVD